MLETFGAYVRNIPQSRLRVPPTAVNHSRKREIQNIHSKAKGLTLFMRLPTIFKSKQKFLPFIIVYHKNSLLLWRYDNINTLKTQAYVVNKVTAESTFQIKSSARND